MKQELVVALPSSQLVQSVQSTVRKRSRRALAGERVVTHDMTALPAEKRGTPPPHLTDRYTLLSKSPQHWVPFVFLIPDRADDQAQFWIVSAYIHAMNADFPQDRFWIRMVTD
ncbi:hypothetical protein Bbelb_028970 [Branchiostoma belcheri]|nr:hypothetical protein Bbelb_028970 [Branchiostoma belcheri]